MQTPARQITRRFLSGNRFDRMERAGAFGDLGTLIGLAAYHAHKRGLFRL
jgi:hypothetical protein